MTEQLGVYRNPKVGSNQTLPFYKESTVFYMPLYVRLSWVSINVCVYIYIYIYTHTRTHIYIHTQLAFLNAFFTEK